MDQKSTNQPTVKREIKKRNEKDFEGMKTETPYQILYDEAK